MMIVLHTRQEQGDIRLKEERRGRPGRQKTAMLIPTRGCKARLHNCTHDHTLDSTRPLRPSLMSFSLDQRAKNNMQGRLHR